MKNLDAELAALEPFLDDLYEWRGGNKEMIESTDREVIAVGGAETGKTFAACYKTHYLAREYAGSQRALVRKVAASIPGTVMVTMKRVIGNFPISYYGGDKSPERIIYPNGSVVWVGGMDDPSKVLSGERDSIQVCQAEELTQDDWETMTTRVTGRGAVSPYTQLFGDCNPAHPKHHLLQRANAGKLRMLKTTHKDNPTLWDGSDWTEQGRRTIETLSALSGVRRKRLLDGEWATAEGAVFENVTLRPITAEEIKEFDRVTCGIDWGFDPDPFAFVRLHYDSAKRTLYIYDEYKVNRKSNPDTFAALRDEKHYQNYELIIADSADKKAIYDYRAYGANIRAASKGANSRMISYRWLQGLVEIVIDPQRAPNSADEFLSAEYQKTRTGELTGEYPEKEDHFIDATRYGATPYWMTRGE